MTSTIVVCEEAKQCGARQLVLISTDKAVRPTNKGAVMPCGIDSTAQPDLPSFDGGFGTYWVRQAQAHLYFDARLLLWSHHTDPPEIICIL